MTNEKMLRLKARVEKSKKGVCPECDSSLKEVKASTLPPFTNGRSIYEGLDKGLAGWVCSAAECKFSCATCRE